MAMSTQGLLLKRLRTVLSRWPENPSRKGRDLGEFLSQSYRAKFEEESMSNAAKARESIESLERLCDDHYRIKYKRDLDIAFCGEKSAIPPEVLSNENMEKMNKKSNSLWERIKGSGKNFSKQ